MAIDYIMLRRLDLKQETILAEQAFYHAEGFKELYCHYFPLIYAYVAYRVGGVQDVEDLVSETFLRAIRNHFEYRGEGSFAAWLFCIAHNLVKDFYRLNRKWKEPLPLEVIPELWDGALLPDDAVQQQDQFDLLRQLIRTLSPRRQEVITLKFFGGLRNREIAEVLKLDERAVASHLCRGLDELHRKYVNTLSKEEDHHEHQK